MVRLVDAIAAKNARGGCLFGLAGGEDDPAQGIALDELNNVESVHRLFQGLTEIGQLADALAVDGVHDQALLVLYPML